MTEHQDTKTDHGTPIVLSREGVRALDRSAIEELGIPGIILMENAAMAIERECMRLLRDRPDRRVVIVAGAGNNAGDGFALARRLWVGGVRRVRIVLALEPERVRGDAAINLSIAQRMGIPIERLDAWAGGAGGGCGDAGSVLLIDALLGTGLDRPLEGAIGVAASRINAWREAGAFVLSIDVPSGLDADTGEPIGDVSVVADQTITLAAMKPGLARAGARRHAGVVTVGGIGVADDWMRRFA